MVTTKEKKTKTISNKAYLKMSDQELLKYYDGLKGTNKHLKFLLSEGKLQGMPGWTEALRRRGEYLDEVRFEMLTRMEIR